MSLCGQIFVVIDCYLLSFLYIRGFLGGLIFYQLNTNARKKRKKGQTFKEWFLYSRYHEEIPKILFIVYFAIITIHTLVLISCIIFNFIKPLDGVGHTLAKGIFYFDVLWITIIHLLFWQDRRDCAYRYKYERWIKKKGGNKKK